MRVIALLSAAAVAVVVVVAAVGTWALTKL